MLKICITNSNKKMINYIDSEVNNALFSKKASYKVYKYFNGNDFVDGALKNDFSIVILDTQFSTLNGISIVKYLRSKDKEPIYIYTSNEKKFIDSLFDINVFAYVNHNKFEKKFPIVLEECLEYIYIYIKSFLFKVEDGYANIKIDDIKYVEYTERKIICHCKLHTYRLYNETLTSLFNHLNRKNFVFISRNKFINLEFFTKYEDRKVFLGTETDSLSVSKEREKILICLAKNQFNNRNDTQ